MEISSAHELQTMTSHGLEELFSGCLKSPQPEKKPRLQPEQALKCPRCDSTNTKFCYYNNYSLTQPRYFCKGCRRYWTKGGSLRNVPVGGSCRKNKRSSSSASSSSSYSISSSRRPQDDQSSFISSNSTPLLPSLSLPSPFAHLSYDHGDLTLDFARLQKQQQQPWLPLADHDQFLMGNPNPNSANIHAAGTGGFLKFMRNGILEHSSINGFHHIYYGNSTGSAVEEMDGSTITTVGQDQVLLPLDKKTTSAAGERSSKAMDEHESKVLMGLQWPIGVDGGLGIECSSWHGLINSSLM